MKYLSFLAIWIFSSCSKEFLNDCDSMSEVFKSPVAAFTSQKNGSKVIFINKSENANRYNWDFGDGTKSNETNPEKTYSKNEVYTVKLTASRCQDLESSISENIDMKCEASSPAVTPPSKKILCDGETIPITASCTNGTIIWSNGSSSSTILVATAGSYFVQCNKNGCLGTKSEIFEIILKAKPATPVVNTNLAKICKGENVTFTASGCTNGTILWSNSKTGPSIVELPTSSISLSAKCLINGCNSDDSAPKEVLVEQIAEVSSLKGTYTGSLFNYTVNFNGEINFNNPNNTGSVIDHGFIYNSGSLDPQGNKSAIKVTLGKKTQSSGRSFTHALKAQTSNIFTYRAYVTNCDNKTIYGSSQKTN